MAGCVHAGSGWKHKEHDLPPQALCSQALEGKGRTRRGFWGQLHGTARIFCCTLWAQGTCLAKTTRHPVAINKAAVLVTATVELDGVAWMVDLRFHMVLHLVDVQACRANVGPGLQGAGGPWLVGGRGFTGSLSRGYQSSLSSAAGAWYLGAVAPCIHHSWIHSFPIPRRNWRSGGTKRQDCLLMRSAKQYPHASKYVLLRARPQTGALHTHQCARPKPGVRRLDSGSGTTR